ncbi:unnamed protein product, partial [marine sediment metagenome]
EFVLPKFLPRLQSIEIFLLSGEVMFNLAKITIIITIAEMIM